MSNFSQTSARRAYDVVNAFIEQGEYIYCYNKKTYKRNYMEPLTGSHTEVEGKIKGLLADKTHAWITDTKVVWRPSLNLTQGTMCTVVSRGEFISKWQINTRIRDTDTKVETGRGPRPPEDWCYFCHIETELKENGYVILGLNDDGSMIIKTKAWVAANVPEVSK